MTFVFNFSFCSSKRIEFLSVAIHNTFWYCHIAFYSFVGQPAVPQNICLQCVKLFNRENVYILPTMQYELNFQVAICITICHNMVSSVKMM